MRSRLLIAVLVLMVAGANCDAASICAAYCTSSASAHHYMESQPGPIITSHHIHAHHQGAKCAECPPESGNSLNEKTDCSRLVQIQALKEGYFSLDAPGRVPQLDVSDKLAHTLGSAPDGWSVPSFGAACRIRKSTSTSVPLRI